MSFVINYFDNDTMKYWDTKLKKYDFCDEFLTLKKIEIETFNEFYESSNTTEKEDIIIKEHIVRNNLTKDMRVAVIVPVYVKDEKGIVLLNNLINSIENQIDKADAIIFIDDKSPIQYNVPSHYNLIKLDKNMGPANARNFGIDKALELGIDVIAFTDSDVVLHDNWIKEIKTGFLDNSNAHILSGLTLSKGKTFFDRYHEINGTLNGRRFKETELLLYGPTCNLAIACDFIGETRFSTEFPLAAGEDIHFCFQLLDKECNIFHNESMKIDHDYVYAESNYQHNIKLFKNQFAKYAKGEKVLLGKIPAYYSYLSLTEEISSIVNKRC